MSTDDRPIMSNQSFRLLDPMPCAVQKVACFERLQAFIDLLSAVLVFYYLFDCIRNCEDSLDQGKQEFMKVEVGHWCPHE